MGNKKSSITDVVLAVVGVLLFIYVIYKSLDVAGTPEYKAPANAHEQLTN